jgi:hypothetical protein
VTSLRLWIVLLAMTSFLGGLASGLLAGELRHRGLPARGGFDDYRELLAEGLALDPQRERLLRELLRNYDKDVQRVRDRHSTEILAAAEPELRELGERYRNLIRNRLLDPERREAFDRLAALNQRVLAE